MVGSMHYDPITLNHWLWFRVQCLEASGDEFQTFFEKIIKRTDPFFTKIKPTGRMGDWKSDGFLRTDSTIYQVYSPDTLKAKDTEKKINADFDGALTKWRDSMKRWVFVYNARNGIPPNIPAMLDKKQKKHPEIKIEFLDNDMLWNMLRELSLQERAEILGAPSGYDMIFLSPSSSQKYIKSAVKNAIFTIIQDVISPINLRSVIDGIKPKKLFGAPIYLRPPHESPTNWHDVAEYQKVAVEEILQKTWDLSPRYAVFSIAPIPDVIQLGFILSNRIEVMYFQFNREDQNWRWKEDKTSNKNEYRIAGIPAEIIDDDCEVILRVSISAKIDKRDTSSQLDLPHIEIDVDVDSPDVMWLQHHNQVVEAGRVFRNIFAEIRQKIPKCKKIHLFFAGPTPIALILGQQINPRMTAPVLTYQFSLQTDPRYTPAILLESREIK